MEVKTVAVIGAGTMGRGIGYVAALGGFRTVLEDIREGALEDALRWIETTCDQAVARSLLTPEQKAEALGRLRTARNVEEAVAEADLIIEAAPEDIELKVELFGMFDRFAPRHAILATNTSSLSVTEMAAVTQRPDRCVGMHFFNPVPKMKLLELVRGLETSQSTLETCAAVGRRMGKEVVIVRDSPGFITSRINAVIGNEAFALLEAGVASAEDIDRAVRLGLNHPMGPFELVDLVGLDVRLSVLEYLHRTLGEKYRPSPLLRQYVQAGRLGRKVGRGVYDYRAGQGGSSERKSESV